ncbi:hypothetical protein [Magnetococcus sp. PR-3]|uniref:hypothetical protein n=1 Tax=Magnetococcus sp. PR-3 TaxID=3120355 RepID=UPI002FCDE2BC
MYGLRLALMILLVLFLWVPYAQAASCAKPPRPTVLVNASKAKPLNIKRITRSSLIRKAGMPYVRGLTTVKKFNRYQFKFGLQNQRNGTLCLYVTNLTMAVGYKDTQVYMDNSYPPGSCEFRVIKAHELKHVRIYNDSLLKELGQLKRSIQHTLSSLTQRTNRQNLKRSQVRMERKVKRLVQSSFKRLQRKAKLANNRIDTRSAYQREQRKCRNW